MGIDEDIEITMDSASGPDITVTSEQISWVCPMCDFKSRVLIYGMPEGYEEYREKMLKKIRCVNCNHIYVDTLEIKSNFDRLMGILTAPFTGFT